MSGELFQLISRVQADYARCIDGGTLEEWPSFFAQDCLYMVTTADNHARGLEAGIIYLDSHGMLRDRISALRDANIYERQTYRHILGAPSILHEEGGSAETETSFLVARIMREGKTDIFATGRYLDQYRVSEGTAKLRRRIVVCDSTQIDTLLALPL